MILEVSTDAPGKRSKFKEKQDSYTVSKRPAINYLLMAKGKTATLK